MTRYLGPMPGQPATKRRHRGMGGTFAVLLLAGIAGYGMLRDDPGSTPAPHCAVGGRSGGVAFTMEPQQAANAATIEAVGSARGLPERAVTIAIATAMQESMLRNLDYGDRDSLGLFQQRPSQGWGTPEQVMDPVYAARQFYDRLLEVDGYETLPLTEAAQAVQRSAFPDLYAQHEEEASVLAAALTGRRAAALNCVVGDEPARGRPAEIERRIAEEFGGGVAVNGDGARVTFPVDGSWGPRRGWELAHWAVAHAAELGIERIGYGARVWEAGRSADGWREITDEGQASGLRLGTFPAEPAEPAAP
jgi:hypothetical protein